jgi:hypothetical protein
MSIRVIVRTGQSVFFFSSKMDLRTGGVAQVVELLPCKPEAVSSNPNTAKKETNKQKKYRESDSFLEEKRQYLNLLRF